ncbi:MAG: IS3 family transposase, partial [Tissierellia bacterium]|nr:IS3 family transposase [Tissierellia bacterium]
ELLQLELSDYVNWYNNCRLHQSLGYLTPNEVVHNTHNLFV